MHASLTFWHQRSPSNTARSRQSERSQVPSLPQYETTPSHIQRHIQGGTKNGATLSHCKYSENAMTELCGNW